MANRINPSQIYVELAATTPPCRTDGLSIDVAGGTPSFSTTASGGAWTTAQVSAVNAVIAAHNPAVQSPQQVYDAAIQAGCQVVSSANPGTLNATYGIDPATAAEIAQLYDGIQAGSFSATGAVIAWPDLAGVVHNFAPGDFTNLGKALLGYVLALVAQKRGGSAPTQPVTIP